MSASTAKGKTFVMRGNSRPLELYSRGKKMQTRFGCSNATRTSHALKVSAIMKAWHTSQEKHTHARQPPTEVACCRKSMSMPLLCLVPKGGFRMTVSNFRANAFCGAINMRAAEKSQHITTGPWLKLPRSRRLAPRRQHMHSLYDPSNALGTDTRHCP